MVVQNEYSQYSHFNPDDIRGRQTNILNCIDQETLM